MKNLTIKETTALLLEKDNFSILSHRRPDGDTLGSSALLCRALRTLGKTAHILENPEITEKYAHLHLGLTKKAPETGDFLVCVDTASAQMLGASAAHLAEKISLRIDHHGTATPFTPYSLVMPQMAACGEIIYEIVKEMGVALDADMANALYTAVSTDTGCFRFANTTAHTFLVAAACAEAGAKTFEINQALFETNTLARLRVQSYMLEKALFLDGGKFVICALPKAVEEEFGANEDDLDNISGFPRTIQGVKLAATLRQEGSGVKLSVRAVPGYDAAAVCARFGGGGHKGAAGASMHMTLDEAVQAVKEAITQM